jgi:hypothetical protein
VAELAKNQTAREINRVTEEPFREMPSEKLTESLVGKEIKPGIKPA